MSNSNIAKRRINVTTTAYDGDAAFPEAEHYPEYVAEQLAQRYSAEVECSVGSRTEVFCYGFEDDGGIEDLVEHGLWEDFCARGYRAYTAKVAP